MGFFSEIASEARRGMAPTARPATIASPLHAAPKPESDPPVAPPEAPAEQPKTAQKEPSAQTLAGSVTEPAGTKREPASAPGKPAHQDATSPPAVDLTPEADAADEAERRRTHEAAEAKRKAEWDANQAEKKAAEQAELDKLAALSDDDVSRLSAHRVAADVEKITRRSMKEQVADHVQALCLKDPAFARKTMHPRKSMIRCFRYISRKAFEYVKDELEADGIEPGPGSEGYGCDVPDDLCFQWAVDYFNDPDALEDKPKQDEFVSKPYIPSSKAKAQSGTKKKQSENKKPSKPKGEADTGQIALGGFAPMEVKAG